MEEDDLNFQEYSNIMKRNWLLIALVFLLVIAGTALYTVNTKPTYEATSLVVITNQDQTTAVLGSILPKTDIGTQAEIIKSATVQALVSSQVMGEYTLSVQAIKDSNVIGIKAESPDPMVAKLAADATAEAYLQYIVESKRMDAVDVSDFITQQIESNRHELSVLNANISKYKNMKKALTNQQTLDLQNLNQEAAAKEKLYNTLLARREEVGIIARQTITNVRILQLAEFPIAPTKPNVLLNAALGLVLGAVLSLGAAFGKENLKNSVKQNDMEKIGIPRISRVLFQRSRSYIRHSAKEMKGFSESMRILRTALAFIIKDRELKIIEVTSPEEKDGKTTVVSNLGVAMSHAGLKVLLIDANLRKPMLAKAFKIESEKGLSDVLLSNTRLESVIRHSSEGPYILPAGAANDSPSELLGSRALKELFADLKKNDYDAIIVDSPSLDCSDSVLISSAVDGVMLIIGNDKTKKDSLERISALPKKPFGYVENMAR